MLTNYQYPEDLIDKVLPAQEISILAGASGAGKTTLIMQILALLQRGEDVYGHKAQRGLRIAYIAADRTFRSYQELAEATGVDLERVEVRALVNDPATDMTLDTLFNIISTFEKPLGLVVVDPLPIFLGCDLNKYHQVAARLMRLNTWCRTNEFTMLGTHHATKPRTDFSFQQPQDRISGSSALLGFTSTQLFLADPSETGESYHQWFIVSHNAPQEEILLLRDPSTGMFIFADRRRPQQASEQIELAILDAFPPPQFGMARADFQRKLAYPSHAVDRYLAKLVTDGLIEQVHYGYYRRTSRTRSFDEGGSN